MRRFSVSPSLAATCAVGLFLLLPEALMAQPPARSAPVTAAGRSCDMSNYALTVRIVDERTRLPVTDAAVTLWREGAESPFRRASLFPVQEGRWIILEDGDLRIDEPGDSVAVWVQVERAGRPTVRRELQVGLDAKGCHLELRGGKVELVV